MKARKILLKAEKIQAWLPEYIEERFSSPLTWGHTFDLHVNCSDTELCRRSAAEHIDASSFEGEKEEILSMLKDTLLQESSSISLYLADDEDKEDWEIEGILPTNIAGKVFATKREHEWDQGALQCNRFVVIIKKLDTKEETGFFVRTAYPIL